MSKYKCISEDVKLGRNVRLSKFVNLYGCTIGENTKIGAFVEVQKNAVIGKNCKISSHTFICEGANIGDNCFIGHGVMFINDNYPKSTNPDGTIEVDGNWGNRFVTTNIEDNVSVGSNVTILGGVTIGAGSLIGAGALVTKDVPPNQIWAGNPAKIFRANKEK